MSAKQLPHQHCKEDLNPESFCSVLSRTEDFERISDIFKQLGDPTRTRIFWLLCHCEECVINIAAMMDMSSPAVSHHLRMLKNTGLINSRREGKEVFYKAADTAIANLLHKMIEQVMKVTCPE
ncbi:MAG: ArsR/SmtB family transcription factor [Candidatus Alectryocaccobium sp.]|nr:metalloregulator ArsR/SmtB family transcription factor [Lachnospiraceae bacterium]MDY6221875.1 metalloregulator ArsR/SmtB family transcription factor [Candidatus Alectryocaccobium sp.]